MAVDDICRQARWLMNRSRDWVRRGSRIDYGGCFKGRIPSQMYNEVVAAGLGAGGKQRQTRLHTITEWQEHGFNFCLKAGPRSFGPDDRRPIIFQFEPTEAIR